MTELHATPGVRAAVLGGGSWGTALAHMLAGNGYSVHIWAREQDVIGPINERNENPVFLPGIPLHAGVRATNDMPEATAGAALILSVVPSQFLRSFVVAHRGLLPPGVPIVNCAKGIEESSLMTPFEILRDELPGKFHPWLACLSGPSFAKEVALGLPTNVVVAAPEEALALHVQRLVRGPRFRAYVSGDVTGVEIGGAAKNVIAVACGAADGMGFGHNTRAGLLTRGLAEITRLAVRKGGRPQTLAGLAGMGDLVLTCTGDLSRNRTVGFRLGRGEPVETVLQGRMVAEGVASSRSIARLAESLGVEMPITREVCAVLHDGKPITAAMEYLIARVPGAE